MTMTPRLDLPMLQPAQAQKHVTVNEALLRLDALAMLVLQTRSAATPPQEPEDGTAWALAAMPSGEWAGQGGRIALRLQGGWEFVTPRRGWQAYIADEAVTALHDGSSWRGGALALSPSGAGSFLRVKEFDHELGSGAFSQTAETIPANVLVLAVTARVTEAITGSLSTWRLAPRGPRSATAAASALGSGPSRVGCWARRWPITPPRRYG